MSEETTDELIKKIDEVRFEIDRLRHDNYMLTQERDLLKTQNKELRDEAYIATCKLSVNIDYWKIIWPFIKDHQGSYTDSTLEAAESIQCLLTGDKKPIAKD